MPEVPTTITKPYTISVHSGGFFNFKNPPESEFVLDDIAHALSQICRYTGHSTKFYSVAEHCVHASRLAPAGLELTALMHDAAEAFIGDVNSPLKAMLPEFKKIEHAVEKELAKRFGLCYPFPKEIKEVDILMYRTEVPQVTSNNDGFWYTEVEPADLKIECWQPAKAKREWLKRYVELVHPVDNDYRVAA